jgi:hypothetical protein
MSQEKNRLESPQVDNKGETTLKETLTILIRKIVKRGWGLFLLALTFAAGATAQTVIGNWGSEIVSEIIGLLVSVLHNPYFWLGTIILVLSFLVFRLWLRSRYLYVAFENATNAVETDDSLLRTIASWDLRLPYDMQLKKVLNETLRDIIDDFDGEIQRGYILLPTSEASEELSIWVHFRMPDECLDMKFYVGDSETKRASLAGVAGIAYLKKKLCIIHIDRLNGAWQSDHPDYRVFNEREYPPAYRSSICIPIVGPYDPTTNQARCLGVLVFDSPHRTYFDSSHPRVILRMYSRRVALAILACQTIWGLRDRLAQQGI